MAEYIERQAVSPMIDYDRIPYTPKASTGEHVRTNAFYNPVDEPETHGGRYEMRKPMDDYISRQAVVNKCGDWYVEEGNESGFIGSVNQMLDMFPAADVVPVRLGEWLDGYKMQTCSLCKCRGKKSWTFCPHCGARMIYGGRKE